MSGTTNNGVSTDLYVPLHSSAQDKYDCDLTCRKHIFRHTELSHFTKKIRSHICIPLLEIVETSPYHKLVS